MFLIGSVRWFVTSLAFHSALTYAAFLALKRPNDIQTLKLWMLLGVITATSYLLGDALSYVIPMFFEVRAIAVWGIIMMEPIGWADAYDKMCAPMLIGIASAVRDAAKSGYAKMGALFLANLSLMVTSKCLALAGALDALGDSTRARNLMKQLREEIAESRTRLNRAGAPAPEVSSPPVDSSKPARRS